MPMLRAVASPDILLIVLDHIMLWEDCDDRLATLRSASLVSRSWRSLAQPFLWRAPPSLETFETQTLFLRGVLSSAADGAPLGEFVRNLDLSWFPIAKHTDLIMHISRHCHNVSTLRLRRGPAADVDGVTMYDLDFVLRLLSSFPALKHLNVNHIDDASGVATALALPDFVAPSKPAPLPRLRSLCMTGLPHLDCDPGMFSSLHALQISAWTRMSHSRITALAKACPELRSLRLQWNVVDVDVCAFVEHCPMLETIDVIQLRETSGPAAPSHGSSSATSSWIQLAAQNLIHLRCLRTNAAAYTADLQALSTSSAPLSTLALNRVEVSEEQDIVALVTAHHTTLRNLTLINWDAISVRGLPAGDATLCALSSCPNLETIEVDFEQLQTQGETLHFIGERRVQDKNILQLLDRCPKLVRTPELITLGSMHSTDAQTCSKRIALLPDWEPEMDSEVAYEVMGW